MLATSVVILNQADLVPFNRAWHQAHVPSAVVRLASHYLPVNVVTTELLSQNIKSPATPTSGSASLLSADITPLPDATVESPLTEEQPPSRLAYYLQRLGGHEALASYTLKLVFSSWRAPLRVSLRLLTPAFPRCAPQHNHTAPRAARQKPGAATKTSLGDSSIVPDNSTQNSTSHSCPALLIPALNRARTRTQRHLQPGAAPNINCKYPPSICLPRSCMGCPRVRCVNAGEARKKNNVIAGRRVQHPLSRRRSVL